MTTDQQGHERITHFELFAAQLEYGQGAPQVYRRQLPEAHPTLCHLS